MHNFSSFLMLVVMIEHFNVLTFYSFPTRICREVYIDSWNLGSSTFYYGFYAVSKKFNQLLALLLITTLDNSLGKFEKLSSQTPLLRFYKKKNCSYNGVIWDLGLTKKKETL